MNLVDQLLKADVKKAEDMKTSTFHSKRLARILGQEDVLIEIREVKPRRANDIISYQLDRNGDVDFSKSFDAKLMMCVEGITNPNLRDKELQQHFECDSAKELCEKLFGAEVNEISDEITVLSGIIKDEEPEIKN